MCYTPGECITNQYAYTQWSTTAQVYDTTGDFRSCLNHQISLKIVQRNDSDINVVIDNVIDLLNRFKRTGYFGSLNLPGAVNTYCQPNV